MPIFLFINFFCQNKQLSKESIMMEIMAQSDRNQNPCNFLLRVSQRARNKYKY